MISRLIKRSFFAIFLQILTACLSAAFAENASPRIFTPDWSIAAALTELGHPPMAMGDKRVYPLWSHRPVQPDWVIDAGARFQPNRELLAQLPMTMVIYNFFYAHLDPIYPSNVAQINVLFDGDNKEPVQQWHTYQAATRKIGEAIGKLEYVESYLSRVETDLAKLGAEIRQHAPEVKHYAVAQFGSPHELRLYASNSMFRVAFDLMGLPQADFGVGNRWGNQLISVAELAKLPENTCLLVISPFTKMTEVELNKSYIWRRLGFGKTRCMHVLPPVWLFGGPESISHFAEFLHQAMLNQGVRYAQ